MLLIPFLFSIPSLTHNLLDRLPESAQTNIWDYIKSNSFKECIRLKQYERASELRLVNPVVLRIEQNSNGKLDFAKIEHLNGKYEIRFQNKDVYRVVEPEDVITILLLKTWYKTDFTYQFNDCQPIKDRFTGKASPYFKELIDLFNMIESTDRTK
eukprot:NODE_75_length_23955_cov_0.435069.p17 type:complete len:155 gc:universal NODE_75_length_23955_cov_0.435069:4974-4510(-)